MSKEIIKLKCLKCGWEGNEENALLMGHITYYYRCPLCHCPCDLLTITKEKGNEKI